MYLTKIGFPAYCLQTLESGLSNIGITANDIDLIIQTHLHHDHVGFASRFPNARVLVQKRELESARNPHPMWAGLYDEKLLDNLNFEIIDGDFQISEYVSVLFTPGHTPGSQSVSVRTDDGIAIIAGDVPCRHHVFKPHSSPCPCKPHAEQRKERRRGMPRCDKH